MLQTKRAEAQKNPTFATHCRKTIKIELAINDDDDGREWSQLVTADSKRASLRQDRPQGHEENIQAIEGKRKRMSV